LDQAEGMKMENILIVPEAAGYIDKTILTLNHVYQNPIIKFVYGSGPFDPEGILGNFLLNLCVYKKINC